VIHTCDQADVARLRFDNKKSKDFTQVVKNYRDRERE
jgi:hypothetical protein